MDQASYTKVGIYNSRRIVYRGIKGKMTYRVKRHIARFFVYTTSYFLKLFSGSSAERYESFKQGLSL